MIKLRRRRLLGLCGGRALPKSLINVLALLPPVEGTELSEPFHEPRSTVTGLVSTNQSTPSVHGGVVRDPAQWT